MRLFGLLVIGCWVAWAAPSDVAACSCDDDFISLDWPADGSTVAGAAFVLVASRPARGTLVAGDGSTIELTVDSRIGHPSSMCSMGITLLKPARPLTPGERYDVHVEPEDYIETPPDGVIGSFSIAGSPESLPLPVAHRVIRLDDRAGQGIDCDLSSDRFVRIYFDAASARTPTVVRSGRSGVRLAATWGGHAIHVNDPGDCLDLEWIDLQLGREEITQVCRAHECILDPEEDFTRLSADASEWPEADGAGCCMTDGPCPEWGEPGADYAGASPEGAGGCAATTPSPGGAGAACIAWLVGLERARRRRREGSPTP